MFRFISGVMFLLCLLSCATKPPVDSPTTAALDTDEIREKNKILKQEVDDEIYIGRGIAAKLLGHFGSYSGPKEAFDYVNLVGQTLVKHSGRPELKYYFGILNSEEVNAFATPGGYIFVTKGLLKYVKSESELAVVLAHELAHVNEKHMYNEVAEKRQVSTQETITRVLARGQSDVARAVVSAVDKGMKVLMEEGLSPKLESEADEAGLQYATASGYRASEFKAFLKRLSATNAKLPKSAPSLTDRLSEVDALIRKEGLGNSRAVGRSKSEVLAKRFSRALASFE